VVVAAVLFAGLGSQSLSAASPQTPQNAVITNCANDAQLQAALLDPGTSTVTFACGAGPQTIRFGATVVVSGQITVEGANRITLDGGDTTALLQVATGGSLTLRNLTVQNGVFNGVHPLENFGQLTLDHVIVRANSSSGEGGAIFNNNRLIVRNSHFIDNRGVGTLTTTSNGAAIYNYSGRATIHNSTFTNNRILSTIGLGGAIAVIGGELLVEGSSFTRNRALDGGALFVGASTVVTVTASSFVDNSAGYGGAIESNGELQLDDSRLISNTADNEGGGIWVAQSDTDITYTTIADNRAGSLGGGISCGGNTVSIIHSTLSANVATDRGGALYSSCNVNLTNSTLDGNSAQGVGGGGGVYQTGSGFATLAAVTLADNSAPVGGGLYNDDTAGSAVTLQFTLLADNVGGNCDGGSISSLGYNFASDTNCALAQTGDVENVALALEPLAAGGGPTWIRMPAGGNPAVNAIPAAACGFSSDQRDVSRPQGSGCDAGAVEVWRRVRMPRLIR
jgi:hypothetical protein